MATPERHREFESAEQVQARAHLQRGVRPARAPKWFADHECRAETLPLFELGEIPAPGKEEVPPSAIEVPACEEEKGA